MSSVARDSGSGGLTFAWTTEAAYRGRIAFEVTAAMRERLDLHDDLSERIATSLHEAITNAIVHGNLDVAGDERASLDAAAGRAENAEMRLRDPRHARKSVVVATRWNRNAVTISVRDEGRGYFSPGGGGMVFGQGLSVIGALSDRVAILEGGRLISMEFRR